MSKSITAQNPLFSLSDEKSLSIAEEQVKQALSKHLDINLTAKKTNKLREIVCQVAGYEGGYQQLKSHWEQKAPAGPEETLIMIMLEQIKLGATHFRFEKAHNGFLLETYLNGHKNIKMYDGSNCGVGYQGIRSVLNKDQALRDKENETKTSIFHKMKTYDRFVPYVEYGDDYFTIDLGVNFEFSEPIFKLHQLGITKLEQFKHQLHQSTGLMLIAGEKFNGRSTTLEAAKYEFMLHHLKETGEYPDIRVMWKTNHLDEAALTNFIIQKPDLIIIDQDISYVNTKLIFKMLDAGLKVIMKSKSHSSTKVVKQLYNLGINQEAINTHLKAILVQKLFSKPCGKCNACEPRSLDLFEITKDDNEHNNGILGCDACYHSGYEG